MPLENKKRMAAAVCGCVRVTMPPTTAVENIPGAFLVPRTSKSSSATGYQHPNRHHTMRVAFVGTCFSSWAERDNCSTINTNSNEAGPTAMLFTLLEPQSRFWGQTSQIPSKLSSKRYCGPKPLLPQFQSTSTNNDLPVISKGRVPYLSSPSSSGREP